MKHESVPPNSPYDQSKFSLISGMSSFQESRLEGVSLHLQVNKILCYIHMLLFVVVCNADIMAERLSTSDITENSFLFNFTAAGGDLKIPPEALIGGSDKGAYKLSRTLALLL